MSHYTRDYARLMRERGFRLTPQRQFVLDAICEGGGHTTFEEIYARVQARSPAINRATVYRTLHFLCDLRLVVAATISGHTVYEIAGETPHHHLVCRECGRVEEMGHEVLRELLDRIERERQFAVDVDHLVLYGECKACRQRT